MATTVNLFLRKGILYNLDKSDESIIYTKGTTPDHHYQASETFSAKIYVRLDSQQEITRVGYYDVFTILAEIGGFALSLHTPMLILAYYFTHRTYIANMIMNLYS